MNNLDNLKAIARAKSGNKCAWCKAPDKELIYRDNYTVYVLPEGQEGEALATFYKTTFISLRLAFIDNNLHNTEKNNLIMLCQKCHATHDKKKQTRSKRYGKNYKRDQYKLF